MNFLNICRISSNKLNNIRYYCTSNDYIPIYKFPYIRACGIINQLKYYQSAVTAIAIPSTLVLNHLNIISGDTALIANTLGITGTLSLFLLGLIPYKLIGFVYLKNDNTTIKLSYLDFWGRRADTSLPLNDLVPLSDLPAIPTDPVYLTMRRFSSKETYKLNVKFGVVLNKDKFNNVFIQNTTINDKR